MNEPGGGRNLRSLARVPALVIALAWSIGLATAVVMAPSQSWLGAVAVALAIPCLALALAIRPAVLALALMAALLGVGRAELPAADPSAASRAVVVAGQTATVSGHVADDSRAAAGGSEVLLEPDVVLVGGVPMSNIGNVMLRWRGPEEAGFGDQVVATGRLALPRDLPSFDRRAYLAQRHAYLELDATSINVAITSTSLTALPGWLRTHYTAGLDASMPAPHAAVLLGVVLGIRQGIPPELQQALIATGLIHLLVLSGLKVAVFARIAQGALRPIIGRYATWPALCLIGLYALAGGATPAAIRAAVMGGMALAAASLGRPTHVWTSLATTAAAMLAWRPELAWDVGFQLSFAGTTAIILLTPAIEGRLGWLPHVLREPFAVTCAAEVGTLPMMATDFHVLSPVGPIANAVVLPILPVIVAAGLVLGPLSVLPEVARVAAIPLAGLLEYLEQVAYLLARLPAASIPVAKFPPWTGLAYYVGVGALVAARHVTPRRRALAMGGAVAAPLLIAATALAMWAEAPSQVDVLAVGNGQALLFRSPQGAILVDAGPSPTRLKDELGQLMPPWQTTLDLLAITAPGLGHVGGFAGLDRPATTVVIPDTQITGSAWRTAAFEAAARGARVMRAHAGDVLQAAGFRLEVISPEPGAAGGEVGVAYLGLRVVAPSSRSFCDLSDLDVDAQTIAAARLQGTCTYLLLPSAGRSLPSPEIERAASGAQLIASLAAGRLARGLPPSVLRTDQEGTITLPM
jgi:competence protein ComEC